MAKQYDYLYKLLLIGDSGVGKTSLLLRFAEDQFSPTFITTIGIDFKIKMLDIEGKRVKLQVWDTAGQERFRTITTAYYRGAMGIILVFDVTDPRSFDSINNWLRNIEEHANTDVEVLLVGNKTDMADKRAVSSAQAQQLAVQSNVKYLEASAKSGLGVERIFQTITRDILLKNERRSATQHPNGQRPATAGEAPVKLTKRKKTSSSGWGKCAIL